MFNKKENGNLKIKETKLTIKNCPNKNQPIKRMRKHTYENLQLLAKERGLEINKVPGILITSQTDFREATVNTPPTKVKLEWWCGIENHQPWKARADTIKKSWCKECFEERRRKNYDDLVNLAKDIGLKKNNQPGVLLTPIEEVNKLKSPTKAKLEWWCGNKSHKPWLTTANSISQGTWCRKCYDEKRRIKYKELKRLAEETGEKKIGVKGQLITTFEDFKKLSKNLRPSKVKLKWWCGNEGHRYWKARPENLMYNDSWCPKCAGNAPLTYNELVLLAKNRGIEENRVPGKLVTSEDEFIKLIDNNSPSITNLKWWCGIKTHDAWEAAPHNIKSGKTWCPHCAEGKFERRCRWYFEKIFNSKFKKTSIKKIISNYSGRMHFDGYSQLKRDGNLIKLAFEYNGPQHYEFPNRYHKTLSEFKEQQQRDADKRILCKENKIFLIEFPFSIDPIMSNPNTIQSFIIKEFEKLTRIKLTKNPKIDHRKSEYKSLDSF